MPNNAEQPIERAHQKRQQGEFHEAGDYYTTGCFQLLGGGPPGRFATRHAKALYHLLLASTCFAIGGNVEFSATRRDIGVAVATELATRTRDQALENPYDRARSSAWYEYAGDFCLITGEDGWENYYSKAKYRYEEVGDPPWAHREQEHMYLQTFFEYVMKEVEMFPDEFDDLRRNGTLTDWLDLKREVLPAGIELLVDGSTWLFPGEASE